MADKRKGYAPIWRSIRESKIWIDPEPFDRRSAWVDLILSVNHEQNEIIVRGQVQVIKPGQMWTSITKLAKRWHWSKNRVQRYFKLLKALEMVTLDGTASGTLLTLVNYDNFALKRDADGYADGYAHGYAGGYAGGSRTINIDNDKENEKEKEKPTPLPSAPPTQGGEWQ